MRACFTILCSLVFLVWAHNSVAAPTLLSVAIMDGAQSQYWWVDGPNSSAQEKALRLALEQNGLQIVDPGQNPNPPRLSPLVYGRTELTAANAKNLGTLYGAKFVLNGTMQYNCQAVDDATLCSLQSTLELIPTNPRETKSIALKFNDSGVGATALEAKTNALQIASLSITSMISAAAKTDSSPERIYPESLLIFRALTTADPLVELRRTLRSIAGVTDLTERLATQRAVGIEINPQQRDTDQAVLAVAQALIASPPPGMKLRQIRQTAQGIELEVIVF